MNSIVLDVLGIVIGLIAVTSAIRHQFLESYSDIRFYIVYDFRLLLGICLVFISIFFIVKDIRGKKIIEQSQNQLEIQNFQQYEDDKILLMNGKKYLLMEINE